MGLLIDRTKKYENSCGNMGYAKSQVWGEENQDTILHCGRYARYNQCANFGDKWLMGYDVAKGQICVFLTDLHYHHLVLHLRSFLLYIDAFGLTWGADTLPVKQNMTTGFSLPCFFGNVGWRQQGHVKWVPVGGSTKPRLLVDRCVKCVVSAPYY